MSSYPDKLVVDPIKFVKLCWPHIQLYDRQKEILYSIIENDDTTVPAGNMLGKDFVSGLAVLYFFMSRHPCRVVTTSVDQSQLEKVLWGEINNFLLSSVVDLPIVAKHCELRKYVYGRLDPKSYVLGRVARTVEGLLGHHLPRGPERIPRTMMVYDEASGIPHEYRERTDTWAYRTLVIGNCYECQNFFKFAVKGDPENPNDKGGDLPRPNGKGFYRKIIHITADDSPNVKYAVAQKEAGIEPTGEDLVPGVLGYEEYTKRRAIWDPVRQSISLDAQFYDGAAILLYPTLWLNHSEDLARKREEDPGNSYRGKRTLGVDPAEGGDSSAWALCDEYGLIKLWSEKTPDTAFIPNFTIALMKQWQVKPENVLFDRGGGGKQHADALRAKGHNVRTVGFGEGASPEMKQTYTRFKEKKMEYETGYVYTNRRVEMYGLLHLRMMPDGKYGGFAIPKQYYELRRQLSVFPKQYDAEGRLTLPPKRNTNKTSKTPSLEDLIGHSPDEADALVLAVFGLHYDGSGPKFKVF